jgi:alpha-amylase
MNKTALYLLALMLCVVSCQVKEKQLPTTPSGSHPDWIMQGNVYEVNVRQFTSEGTLAAFSKHLDRLKEMGVQTLWFMPLNPISKKDRKGTLGSYYAVASFTSLNPEFGTTRRLEKSGERNS